MNKRFLSILSTLSALGVIGTSFLGGINPAEARSRNSWAGDVPLLPGQRRVKYKISNITNNDVVNLCRDNKGVRIYIGYKHEGAQVRCLYVIPTGEIGIKFGAEGEGELNSIIKKFNFKVEAGVKAYNNSKFTPTQEAFPTDDICERKHPGKGTYNIQGGRACEDSYRKNPWEK